MSAQPYQLLVVVEAAGWPGLVWRSDPADARLDAILNEVRRGHQLAGDWEVVCDGKPVAPLTATLGELFPGRAGRLLVLHVRATAAPVAPPATPSYLGVLEIRGVTYTVSASLLEQVSESIARERTVFPLAHDGRTLTLAMANPSDYEVDWFRFTLDKHIHPVRADAVSIRTAINDFYSPLGDQELESIGSSLQEFTDTQIEFTDAEIESTETNQPAPIQQGSEFDLALDADDDELDEEVESYGQRLRAWQGPPAAPESPAVAPPPARVAALRPPAGLADTSVMTMTSAAPPREVGRRATVRYYERMHPQRLYPLLVVISERAVAKVEKKGTAQREGDQFRVKEGSVVEVEPVLPGCQVTPPRQALAVGGASQTLKFWVAPQITGDVQGACVRVTQAGATLSEVPLEVRVTTPTLTYVAGMTTFVMPGIVSLMKHYRLDFESQTQDGFDVYLAALDWLVQSSPWLVAAAMAGVTAALYWWTRPVARDVFWDVELTGPRPRTFS